MVFIKEESEDVRIEEAFRVKHEDTDPLTDLMVLKEETEEVNQMQDKDQYKKSHDFISGQKSYRCSQTEKTAAGKRAQKTTRSYFTCQQCGKSFNQQGNLKVHMRIHTGEKPFICQECGKLFSEHGNLKVHMRIHTGEKPFSCQQCGKSFMKKGHLQSHMSVHTGEKPYTCPRCGMCFTQQGSINRHLRVHAGEKPYSCKLCRFTTQLNLRYHMNSHTGEKPFTCGQCGKTFRHKVTLTKHTRTH